MFVLSQRWNRCAFALAAGALILHVATDLARAANPVSPIGGASTPKLENMDPTTFVEAAGGDDDPFGLEEAIADGLELELVSRPATGEDAIEFIEVRGHFFSEDDKPLPLWRPIAKFLVDHRPGGGSWLVTDILVVRPLTVHEAVISPSRAIEAVEGTDLPGRLGVHGVAPVVVTYPDESRIAWRVDPSVDHEALYNSVFLVDDRSGSARILTNRLYFSRLRAYARNPVATPEAESFELASLAGAGPFLDTPALVARNCVDPEVDGACVAVALATADDAGDFLYDPVGDAAVGDPFAETSAYFHVDRVSAWLAERGFTGHSCQHEGLPITVTTNFAYYADHQPIGADFAFYAGPCQDTITLGQGTRDAAYDGDIVIHEFAHGVVETLAGENYGVETFTAHSAGYDSRAIAEGFADFLAASVNGDSRVGTHFFGEDARDLDNDFTCPTDLTGETHADGQLVAGALWAASQSLGDEFLVVATDSLMIVGDDASFEDYAAALVTVTRVRLGEQAEAIVTAILEARGLLDCERVVPIDELGGGGEHPGLGRGVLYLLPPEAWYEPLVPLAPPPLQLAVAFPAEHNTATVRYQVAGAGQRVVALVHSDTPVNFSYEIELSSRGVISPDTLALSGAESGELTLEGVPGQTQYVALVHGGPQHGEGFQQAIRLLDFEVEYSWRELDGEPGETDSEGTEAPEEDGEAAGDGCACATEMGRGDAAGLSWLAFAALLWTRRPRRRNGRRPH